MFRTGGISTFNKDESHIFLKGGKSTFEKGSSTFLKGKPTPFSQAYHTLKKLGFSMTKLFKSDSKELELADHSLLSDEFVPDNDQPVRQPRVDEVQSEAGSRVYYGADPERDAEQDYEEEHDSLVASLLNLSQTYEQKYNVSPIPSARNNFFIPGLDLDITYDQPPVQDVEVEDDEETDNEEETDEKKDDEKKEEIKIDDPKPKIVIREAIPAEIANPPVTDLKLTGVPDGGIYRYIGNSDRYVRITTSINDSLRSGGSYYILKYSEGGQEKTAAYSVSSMTKVVPKDIRTALLTKVGTKTTETKIGDNLTARFFAK